MYLLAHQLVVRVDDTEPLSCQVESVLHAPKPVCGVLDKLQLLEQVPMSILKGC